ncbi:response regulator transcription factor [Polaromonas sp. SM01]|uniref:response regulator transcription factor n=1 Tax=Polaromonas sp. SM01 TaxID=3085630 RepID=UPI002982525B|nr:response regulator transcription factor [Polaromonas sp. SM01]MDW5444409.1 response regulator transcription factor [Polaromonas sp. SM01]
MENVTQPSGLLQPSACGIPGLTQTQTVQPSRETESSLWPHFLAGQPGQPVRVLLIDDDASIRKVIANELLGDLRTDLVAQGTSVREGRRLISQHEFDVMLIDLNLGDGTGFELIEYMKSVRPMAEALVISAMEDEDHALHAFELGATGYFVKNSWFGNFSQAVLQVVNGGASITPSLARRLLHKLNPAHENSRPTTEPAADPIDRLSDREKEVLKMVASGYTSGEIGLRLTISCQTVNAHTKNIYRKLHVRNRAHAVSYAARHGLL